MVSAEILLHCDRCDHCDRSQNGRLLWPLYTTVTGHKIPPQYKLRRNLAIYLYICRRSAAMHTPHTGVWKHGRSSFNRGRSLKHDFNMAASRGFGLPLSLILVLIYMHSCMSVDVYTLDTSNGLGRQFHGIGAISGGGVSRNSHRFPGVWTSWLHRKVPKERTPSKQPGTFFLLIRC